ncbi:uncharacterized protein LOC113464645 [Ceratina calcarata]|uniref:Uncharacterized protein LOC113464645 n=1 Tax=Ceratina calcarata TaxID=156304 RepID=A0AAJ7S4T0_9HYME|nr:uncharacterized protein LOC113464645 [Ceratina calcarata]
MDECTGSTVPKETDENNSNAQANRINAMIKELAELRVNYHKARKTRNYCWAQESTLSVNIALTKMKCENLRKRETDLKVLTSEIIKQEEIIQQDLKNLMSQRMLRTLKKRTLKENITTNL